MHDNLLLDHSKLTDEEIKESIKEDSKATNYIRELAKKFYKDNFLEASSDMLFTSAKHNINVKLVRILIKINLRRLIQFLINYIKKILYGKRYQ